VFGWEPGSLWVRVLWSAVEKVWEGRLNWEVPSGRGKASAGSLALSWAEGWLWLSGWVEERSHPSRQAMVWLYLCEGIAARVFA
jgi:hypothetical protein